MSITEFYSSLNTSDVLAMLAADVEGSGADALLVLRATALTAVAADGTPTTLYEADPGAAPFSATLSLVRNVGGAHAGVGVVLVRGTSLLYIETAGKSYGRVHVRELTNTRTEGILDTWTGDVTGDGYDDVLFTTQGGGWMLRSAMVGGTLTWISVPQRLFASDMAISFSVLPADVNGDGLVDVVAAYDHEVSVYLNTGSGVFLGDLYLARNLSPANAVADLDGDGALDVVFTHVDEARSTVVVSIAWIRTPDATDPSVLRVDESAPIVEVRGTCALPSTLYRTLHVWTIDVDGDTWEDIVVVCGARMVWSRNLGESHVSGVWPWADPEELLHAPHDVAVLATYGDMGDLVLAQPHGHVLRATNRLFGAPRARRASSSACDGGNVTALVTAGASREGTYDVLTHNGTAWTMLWASAVHVHACADVLHPALGCLSCNDPASMEAVSVHALCVCRAGYYPVSQLVTTDVAAPSTSAITHVLAEQGACAVVDTMLWSPPLEDDLECKACPWPDTCAGGRAGDDADRCLHGYGGYLCADCPPGWFHERSGGCQECASTSVASMVPLGFAPVLVATLFFALATRTRTFVPFGIYVRFLQLTSIVGLFHLNWPPLVDLLLWAMSIWYFDLDMVAPPECSFDVAFDSKWLLTASPLVLVCVWVTVLGGGLYAWLNTRAHRYLRLKRPMALALATRALVLFVLAAYMFFVVLAFQVLDCVQVNGVFVVRTYPSVQCSSPEWARTMPITVMLLLTLGAGLPTLLLRTHARFGAYVDAHQDTHKEGGGAAWLWREDLRAEETTDMSLAVFACLPVWLKYERGKGWFEVVIMAKKVLLAAAALFLTEYPRGQAAFAMMLLGCYVVILLVVQPYGASHPQRTLLDMSMCVATVLLLATGLVHDAWHSPAVEAGSVALVFVFFAGCTGMLVGVVISEGSWSKRMAVLSALRACVHSEHACYAGTRSMAAHADESAQATPTHYVFHMPQLMEHLGARLDTLETPRCFHIVPRTRRALSTCLCGAYPRHTFAHAVHVYVFLRGWVLPAVEVWPPRCTGMVGYTVPGVVLEEEEEGHLLVAIQVLERAERWASWKRRVKVTLGIPLGLFSRPNIGPLSHPHATFPMESVVSMSSLSDADTYMSSTHTLYSSDDEESVHSEN